MIKLYGKPIKVNKASQDKRIQDVGANLFIGKIYIIDLQVIQIYKLIKNYYMIHLVILV